MTSKATIYPTLPLVEEILESWRERIGNDVEGYKNHVYRMLHCCFALYPCTEQDRNKLMIAACHHDIGIWSDHTVDYLPPSIREASAYLVANSKQELDEEITLLIDLHHKVKPIRGELADRFPLLEVFRKADLADFSLGFILGGVPKPFMRRLKQQFPNAGFHKMLMKSAAGPPARQRSKPCRRADPPEAAFRLLCSICRSITRA